MARHEVRANIEHICLQAVATIMKGEGFSYTMPARTSVETKPGVVWVPVRPQRLISRGWPKLGAAWSTAWR